MISISKFLSNFGSPVTPLRDPNGFHHERRGGREERKVRQAHWAGLWVPNVALTELFRIFVLFCFTH